MLSENKNGFAFIFSEDIFGDDGVFLFVERLGELFDRSRFLKS